LILGLSIAGIGFFISLIRDSITISELGFITAVVALLMFFITSFLIILIFYYNREQFLNIISNKGKSDENPVLSILDKVKYTPFAIAVIVSAIFVLSLIFQQTHRSVNMTKKVNQKVQQDRFQQDGISGVASANKSNTSSQKNEGISGVSNANKTTNKDIATNTKDSK
jgi:hypothetical protein